MITIVCGSHRSSSNSLKVCEFIHSQLVAKKADSQILDLVKTPLPIWNEGVWEQGDNWNEAWTLTKQGLSQSEAFVFVVPEYGGMVPPHIKNLILLCSAKELGHKPALLVGVSQGPGGTYPIIEMRGMGYKNNKIVYIPDHVIIRNVNEFLQDQDNERQSVVRDRLCRSIDVLLAYAEAFKPLRENELIKKFPYPFGM